MRIHPTIPAGFAHRAEPESFRARTISASLFVKDLEKSVAWYRDKIGFFVDETFQRGGKVTGVALKAGDVRVLISQDDGGTGWDRVKGAGFTLQFTTAQDIDGLAEAIKERGGRVESDGEVVGGRRVLRLRDPDGFKLVISSAA
jgi:catechol 2,3-dioxygenase-like lactoylglutathione lyase family enzyme